MRQLIFLTIVCAFLATPVFADPTHGLLQFGAQGQMTRLGGYFSGNGGEFTLFDPDGSGAIYTWNFDASKGYAASTSGELAGHSESFQTFCVERDEYSYYGEIFDVWVSLDNKDGTVPGSHAWGGGINANDGDDLNPRTAYLYTKFAQGTLTGYNYTAGAERIASAGALQNAIWFIEQEISSLPTGLATSFYKLANDAVTSGAWVGLGDVRVLQNANKLDYRQDFLYVVPVPGAVLLGMLGLSVAGLKLRKYA